MFQRKIMKYFQLKSRLKFLLENKNNFPKKSEPNILHNKFKNAFIFLNEFCLIYAGYIYLFLKLGCKI